MEKENDFFANEKRIHYGLKRALLMWASWGEKLGAFAKVSFCIFQ